MTTHEESEFVRHEPCPNPECGSSDAFARYSDGHGYCFSCEYYEHADKDQKHTTKKRRRAAGLIGGIDYQTITKRRLTEETCRKWGYGVAKVNASLFDSDATGKTWAQVATYRDPMTGEAIAQKLRDANKNMVMVGEGKKKPPLYGQWLWRDKAKRIVITEGEIDAITVSQLQDHRWPVVSVPTGAKGAKKAISRHLDWLDRFDEVVLMFDNDEEGQEAVAECAPLFAPGRCKVARLPLKDASDMHVAGRGGEVISAIFEAKTYRPDGIVTLDDILDDMLKDPEEGLPWWCPTLTKLTYGRRFGEVYCFGAGTGVGKTDFLTQQMDYDLTTLGEPVGVFALEQKPRETGLRLAGKHVGKRFHVKDGSWTKDELVEAVNKLREKGKLFLYNNFGSMEWEVVRGTIRFLAHNDGVRIFYIDNLTAFAAEAEDEKKMLEQTMAQIAKLANELNIIIHLVSHLSTPDGDPHEEGGRVMIRHFKGSRAIGYWCQFMFGLERDTQAEDRDIRTTTTFRVLKDRFTGDANGEVFYLGYDNTVGRLYERDKPVDAERDYGFGKEEEDNEDF